MAKTAESETRTEFRAGCEHSRDLCLAAIFGIQNSIGNEELPPRHIMTVSDSLYLMELSLLDKDYEVGVIIDNFRLNRCVE